MKLLRRGDKLILERPDYYVQTGSMFENPHGVPPDEIVRMVLDLSPEVAAQVIFGKYVEASGLVFLSDLIQRLFERDETVVRSSAWVDEHAADQARLRFLRKGGLLKGAWNNRFYTGIDFARQNDYTVIFTIDTFEMPARVVYYRRINRVPWDDIYAEVGKARMLFGPNILADSTGMGGDVVMDALHSRRYCTVHDVCLLTGSRCLDDHQNAKSCRPEEYLPLTCVDGYEFGGTGQRKKQLIEHLRNILAVDYGQARLNGSNDFGWLRSPSIPQLEEELSFYAWDDKKLVTDCVMALALAVWHGLEDPVKAAITRSPMGRQR